MNKTADKKNVPASEVKKKKMAPEMSKELADFIKNVEKIEPIHITGYFCPI